MLLGIMLFALSPARALSDTRIVSSAQVEGQECGSDSPVIADSSVCSNYYICFHGYYLRQNCVSGKYFDTNKKTCASRQTALTTEGCNRCEYCDNMFANTASPTDCSTYYYCKDGWNGNVQKCSSQYYFNEETQLCVSEATLAKYAAANGACSRAGQIATAAPTQAPTQAPTRAQTAAPTQASTEEPTAPIVPDVSGTTHEPEDVCDFLKYEQYNFGARTDL